MFELKHSLHTILNNLNGFKAGYTTSVDNKMVIQKDDKVYVVTFEEVNNDIDTAVHELE